MTKSLISEDLTSALYEQWVHERENAHIYLFIAGDLKNRGFDHLASHFEGQHEEEIGHSKIIYDLLTDLNTPVKLMGISEVELQINSILDIASAYLEREIGTTESLDSIKLKAIEEANPVIEERMREMIKLQQNEYEEANTFNDHAELCGSDWFKVMLWDLGAK
jgi:ferritin